MMEFYTQNGQKRPVRLSEPTRRFAWDSLNHRYGQDTRKVNCVFMDDVPGFPDLCASERYDRSIEKIVRECPLRICDGEKISGAATLGSAIGHNVPARFGGQPVFRSVSHLTVDFGTVLHRGIKGIRADVVASKKKHAGDARKMRFLESCDRVLNAFAIWRQRYLNALKDKPEYRANYENLLRVPEEPARNFYEAVQSLWFTFAFLRLCGNWPGIGRIDAMLGDYLKRDLENGTLTLDEAREILAHFFIKGCEWICGGNYGSGDAQHYQNLVLAGVDENGNEITNPVTYLVLDIIEELGISDFPTTVRLSRNTDERLLRRVAEVMKYGGGVLAVYNEDLILNSLTQYGYELSEARRFANDGCWEVQIPGKTYFTYRPFDGLQVLQQTTLKAYSDGVTFDDFESLYRQYIADLDEKVRRIAESRLLLFSGQTDGVWEWNENTPCTAVSLFEQGCIEKGRSYLEGGPVYNIYSPHIGGYPDVLNSLYAIRKLVFEEKRCSFSELMAHLRNDWEGAEPLRQYVRNRYRYFGNDNDEIDLLGKRLVHDFCESCRKVEGICGYRFPAGISTFGRQSSEWADKRLATPFGTKAGAVLAPNCSPTPGTDRVGATAVLRSYGKADLTETVTGAALDLKLHPSAMRGEEGTVALMRLLRGFLTCGGYFLQPDIVDGAILRQAQEHPEDYQTLSVRVSGWNARFVTLNRQWQDMVIGEAEK